MRPQSWAQSLAIGFFVLHGHCTANENRGLLAACHDVGTPNLKTAERGALTTGRSDAQLLMPSNNTLIYFVKMKDVGCLQAGPLFAVGGLACFLRNSIRKTVRLAL